VGRKFELFKAFQIKQFEVIDDLNAVKNTAIGFNPFSEQEELEVCGSMFPKQNYYCQ
jgi:hypothetical protein